MYISDTEKYLLEDLLNRALDAVDSGESGSALQMIKAQAQRIVSYRAEEERKTEEWKAQQRAKEADAGKVLPEVAKHFNIETPSEVA